MSDIIQTLKKHNQDHLAAWLSKTSDESRKNLEAQLAEINWDELDGLIKNYVLKKPETAVPSDLTPAPFFPLVPADAKAAELYKKAEAEGAKLIAEGKVAALTVAGGQGTRLGYDGPKGTYPISPVKNKTFFQYFAESLIGTGAKYGRKLSWYIMTSVLNDQVTKDFFKKNNFFGLEESQVFFFTQGTMPAIGLDGKLLLGAEDSLALAPNGHGGTLLALKKSGALAKMKADGVEYLSYFQIDNPIVPVMSPLFVGIHAFEKSEISSRMLSKTGPFEKLGNFCMSAGRMIIIEYSDMPNNLAEKTNADGSLQFIAGSPAIHVISRSFVERLTADGKLNMPWHRADKKVPFVDENGNKVSPEKINAVKLESFIFDALPLATKAVILEAAREDEFAPTKNPTGVDSVESCRQMMSDKDKRKLVKAGLKVPENCLVELNPASYISDDEIAAAVKSGKIAAPSPNSETYYK